MSKEKEIIKQESKRHHYSPEFLMDKWVIKTASYQKVLHAYFWHKHNQRIRCKKDKGPKYYCHEERLFALEKDHPQGKDIIETCFFGEVDTKGAKVRDILIRNEGLIHNLTEYQRSDFARLLLSLDARRPDSISKLKGGGSTFMREGLDTDKEVLGAFDKYGLSHLPSEYYENAFGGSFNDDALTCIQKLVDNPKVGGVLVNADWHVIHLSDSSESLILSDRPLIRFNAYNSPGAVWVLPLTPRTVFIAANHQENARRLLSASQRQFSKKLNVSSANQADKYVFSTQEHHQFWLGKYLNNKK